MSEKLSGTIKQQFTALCDQLKAANAGLQPITGEQVAAVIVRTILIESAHDCASDLMPNQWDKVPEADKADVLAGNKEMRTALIAMVTPWITAASNTDKLLRAEKMLPAKAENAKPEFA